MDGVADFVDVAGADALLVIGEPRPRGVRRALQIRHQRVHPGGGEKAGGVVVRDQRRTLDLNVSLPDKKLDVFAAQFLGFHGLPLGYQ